MREFLFVDDMAAAVVHALENKLPESLNELKVINNKEIIIP